MGTPIKVSPFFTKVIYMELCKYAKDVSTPIVCNVMCTILNEQCGMYRFCGQIAAPIMNDTYNKYGCNVERGATPMNNEKTVEVAEVKQSIEQEKTTEKKQQKLKEIVCLVNYTKNGRTSISYRIGNIICAMFIDGEYKNEVIIRYVGNVLTKEGIKEIKQK